MELSVQQKFTTYPADVEKSLLEIRQAIFFVAKELNITTLQETLKWAEPSYVSKMGSTIRFDWKAKYPDQIAIYFNCKTSLVETFKEIYTGKFRYEGNRAIIFKLDEQIPWQELKHCIALSLRYHELKHLPLLGA